MGMFGRILLILIALVVVLGVVAVLSNGGLNLGGGGSSSADVPPVGSIWFGTSFDTTTLELSGRLSSVGVQSAFSMVAHIPQSTDGSKLGLRVYLNGSLLTTATANAKGSGDLWGWSLGPLYQPGTWRYEVTDIGGNVLASGEITAQ